MEQYADPAGLWATVRAFRLRDLWKGGHADEPKVRSLRPSAVAFPGRTDVALQKFQKEREQKNEKTN